MTHTDFKRLVKKHNGWIENGDIARFPSVWNYQQFCKEYAKSGLNVDYVPIQTGPDGNPIYVPEKPA